MLALYLDPLGIEAHSSDPDEEGKGSWIYVLL